MNAPSVKNINKASREVEGYQSFREWFDTDNNLYIGRDATKYARREVFDSKWANPFRVCDWVGPTKEWILEDVLKTFEAYVRSNPYLMNSLRELKGKQLGCWCKPAACHGDVLVKLYHEFCEKTAPINKQNIEE